MNKVPFPQMLSALENSYTGALSVHLATLSTDRTFPLRPAYGTLGNAVTLRTDYFEMAVDRSLELRKYSVDVPSDGNGRSPNGRLLKRIIQLLLK